MPRAALLIALALLLAPAPVQTANFVAAGFDIAIEGDPGSFELAVDSQVVEPGVEIATLRLTSAQAAAPPHLTLRWSMPSHDVHGQWNTGARFNKALGPDWGPDRVSSMLARNAPVMSLFGADDGNRLTFAVSDALNTVGLSVGLREEDARVYATVDLFEQRHREVREIAVEVRFDRREVPFHRALASVADWWAAHPGYDPAPVPDAAREPMYSTWYSYHQEVSAAALLGEVKTAAALGYEAIIIDDGWQTLDNRRGYAYTGDWAPERIPDMKALADAVHEHGMKVLLWYSLPLVGERSAAFPKFEGKYLRYWDGQGAWVLDPRYPDVREHIIGTYRRAMREWGIDGFKLDFLGFLVANDATELTAAEGRDYASVNEATDRLMTDIMAELRREEPGVLIEFRQPYIGPLMRKYGNMFRAGDAPDAAVDNRVRTIDLRLTSGDTAVHSDMFMWHYEEPVEVAALQMLNILFAVPQLSVRLGEVPEEHLQMIRFWTRYWRDNRAILLDGAFEPTGPLANYPRVTAHDDRKRIVALYQDMVADIPADQAIEAIDVINAKASARVIVDTEEALGRYRFAIVDTLGNETDAGAVELGPGPRAFDVPPSGLLSLTRTASKDAGGENIRILAYNIHHGEGMDERLDLERIAALIAELQPDLVALQEVDRAVERTDFVDQAAVLGELTGLTPTFGDFMPYQGGHYGMAVLSRWPVVSAANHRLPDGEEPRSALAVRVRSPVSGRELEFVGIHLYRTAAERLAQAQRLHEHLDSVTVPVILAGDFNSLPDSKVVAFLSKSWKFIDKGDDRFTFSSFAPEREIDFIAYRPEGEFSVVTQRLLDEPVASDHRPVFVELSW